MNLLVVGTKFGSTYLEAATSNDHWDIAGIVARTPASRRRVGRKFNVDTQYQFPSLDAAIENCRDVDAVVIATPNHLHYPMAKKVLDAGHHLILEKPIVETWHQAVDLVNSLDAQEGRKACVGQTLRGEIMIRMMAHYLNEGIIGKPEQVIFSCHWWWVDDPSKERNWRFRLPNMLLDDIGIHQLDEIRMLLGNRTCKRLFGMTCTPPSYPIETLNATASGLLQMEGGVHVNYFSSMAAKGRSEGWYGRIEIFGEKGSMLRESSGQPYVYLDGKKEPIGLDDEYGEKIDEVLPLVDFDKIAYILEDFYQAIKKNRAPVTDLHDNLNSHAMLLGMKESARTGKPIDVQECFPMP